MLEFAPVSKAEFDAAVASKLARGGPFAVEAATIRGIHYPRVFAASNQSLSDFLADRCAEFGPRECLIHGDRRLTYDETWAQVTKLAQSLASDYGIGPGDHVAIAMRNSIPWVLAFLAITATGATAVPLNAWWQTGELDYALRDAGARVVFCDARRLERLLPLRAGLDLVLVGIDGSQTDADVGLDALIARSASASGSVSIPRRGVDPDANFCVMYTSGSTGEPKGVMLTHRSVLSTILSWAFVLEMSIELRPVLAQLAATPARILTPLPLFHVTAMHACLLHGMAGGRAVVLMDRWDPVAAVDIIRRERITHISGVPTMTHELVLAAGPDDLATVLQIGTGGAKRPEQHVAEQYEAFPAISPAGGWGLTETNALGAQISMHDYVRRPASTGRTTPPVTQIEIRAADDSVAAEGELGEIMIKSPGNFAGYLGKPDATAAAITADGWFHTGDQGRFDADGFLYIVGRIKEIIIRGGENISCLEVENAIHRQDGVEEVSVFSVPDERLGETVGAMIYPGAGEPLDLVALRDRLMTTLAGFKIPERIWLTHEPLPRGGTGKLDKRAVRTRALERRPDYPPHAA